MDEKTLARFLAKVDKNGPVPAHVPELGPCWLWTGTPNQQGYGVFKTRSSDGAAWRQVKSHRVSYELHSGVDPGELCVLHRCDVRACVNPSHLFLGTNADNVHDKVSKGRHSRGPGFAAIRKRFAARGERNGYARLTEAAVRIIFKLKEAGLSQSQIGRLFGIGQSHVSSVIRRRLWAHVDLATSAS